MKRSMRIVLVIVLMALINSAFGQQQSFNLRGTFTGLKDGTELQLVPSSTHRDEKPMATAIVSNSKASFTGNLAGPRLLRLLVKGSYDGFDIMLDKGNVTVSADIKMEQRGDGKSYVFTNIKVTGSPVHGLYLQKMAPKYALSDEYDAYHKKAQVINDLVNKARDAKDSVQADSLTQTPAWKAFEQDETAFFRKVTSTMKEMIESNKKDWWGPFLMLNTMSYFTPNENKVYESFSDAAKSSFYGKLVKEELFPTGFIGKQAPQVDIKTNNNTAASLKPIIKGQKYTLVDFWASWCVPCRKSIPALKQLYKDMAGTGFQILSISIDKKEADWLKAEKEEQLTWASVIDKGATANAWKVNAIPAMFLLDENGVVIGQHLTLDEVKSKILPK